MRASKILILAAPLLLLGACAAVPTAPARTVTLRPGPSLDVARAGGSAFGLYLAGQAALNDGRADTAADYFDRAQRAGLDAEELRQQSFTSAVLSGDISRAAAVAPSGEGVSAGLERFGRLVRVVEHLATDKGKAAEALLTEAPIGPPHRRIGVLLAPFVAASAGDMDGATSVAEGRGDRIVEVFGQLGQALLYERARRYDEAETNYKAQVLSSNGAMLFPLDYGGFLERRRRTVEAVALYDAALARNPLDADVVAARARAAARKPAPPLPTVRQGAARAIIAASAGAVAERQSQIAQAYLQLALRLDPDREEALILLGDVLAGADDPEAARAAYTRIPVGSPVYSAARTKLAWTYQVSGESETAIRMANEQVRAAPGDKLAATTLADLLRANERYAESAAVLDTVISDKPGEADWRLLYMRGVALEQSGRSADAERDLSAALALRPDEPELLNYLGYLWIDRGVRLDEAQAMIEKALATNPRSGAMIDSLAWAYYRKGDFKTAVEKLEQAVELEPADPDINDHLGDAYWRVGRRVEAEFQWRRVLSLEPDRRRRAEAEAKLANGLGVSGPAQRPTVAGR